MSTLLQQRYELEQSLGRGGFGTVYRAYDTHLGQHVAVKAMFEHSEDAERQFVFEAQLLARLRHPALPIMIDHFVENGSHYLVMEYIPGETLSDYLARQPGGQLDEQTALHIMVPILDALAYMHSREPPILHRDIKPDNIRLTPDGSVYLVDFGLARSYDPAVKTTRGAQAVTAGFSPLEQYGTGSGSTDVRSDLYALGATLYTVLSGVDVPPAPLRALDDNLQPLRQHNANVSEQTESVVMRLLAMQPSARYANVTTVQQTMALVTQPVDGKPINNMPVQSANATIAAGVPTDLTYASFWRRLAAALIDGLVMVLISMLMGEGAGILLRMPPTVMASLIGALVVWLYYPLMEGTDLHASLGKLVFGLTVVDLHGNPINLKTAFVRHSYRLLSAIALPSMLMLLRLVRRPDLMLALLTYLPLLVTNLTPRRQALHDWLTGCVVVRVER